MRSVLMAELSDVYTNRIDNLRRVVAQLEKTSNELEGTIVRIEETGENANENKAAILIFAHTEGELAALRLEDISYLRAIDTDKEVDKKNEMKDNLPYLRRWPPWVIHNYKKNLKNAKKFTPFSIKVNDRFWFDEKKLQLRPASITRPLQNIRAKLRNELERKQKEIEELEKQQPTTKRVRSRIYEEAV